MTMYSPSIVAAAPRQIIKNGLRAGDAAARLGPEGHEDVHVQRGHRLQVKSRAHRAADGVAFNDAVGLHLVDGGDDFFDNHAELPNAKVRGSLRK